VRSYPASRRNPQFAREQLERSLPAAGIGYRWEPRLGGFRAAAASSPNVALRHPSFRGYADHMATPAFRDALDEVLGEAALQPSAVMCSESLWWRCHRRLIADAATLLHDVEVVHLGHDGRQSAHRPTDGVRVAAPDLLVYDAGQARLGEPGSGEPASGEPRPASAANWS
jgi:uncharacterized protein (DUF488 family)